MAFDAHENLAISTVTVAPSTKTAGLSLTVQSGHGSRFPEPPFNATVWAANETANPTNAEIVRVIGINGDVFSIQRTAESSFGPRAIQVGDQIAVTVTAKNLKDIEDGLNTPLPVYYETLDFSPLPGAILDMGTLDMPRGGAIVLQTGAVSEVVLPPASAVAEDSFVRIINATGSPEVAIGPAAGDLMFGSGASPTDYYMPYTARGAAEVSLTRTPDSFGAQWGGFMYQIAQGISVDSSNFSRNLDNSITSVQGALDVIDQLVDETTEFVYNSSTPREGNRYDDWAELVDATLAISGRKTIRFEKPETLPVGSWDLSYVTLAGNGLSDWSPTPEGTAATVTTPLGCSFSSWTAGKVNDGLLVSNQGDPLLESSTGVTIEIEAAGLASTDSEMFRMTNTGLAILAIRIVSDGVLFNGEEPELATQGSTSYGNYELVSAPTDPASISIVVFLTAFGSTIVSAAPLVRGGSVNSTFIHRNGSTANLRYLPGFYPQPNWGGNIGGQELSQAGLVASTWANRPPFQYPGVYSSEGYMYWATDLGADGKGMPVFWTKATSVWVDALGYELDANGNRVNP